MLPYSLFERWVWKRACRPMPTNEKSIRVSGGGATGFRLPRRPTDRDSLSSCSESCSVRWRELSSPPPSSRAHPVSVLPNFPTESVIWSSSLMEVGSNSDKTTPYRATGLMWEVYQGKGAQRLPLGDRTRWGKGKPGFFRGRGSC